MNSKTQNDAAQRRRAEQYRIFARETFQQMSDQALARQNSVVIGGIDREELDRELIRRGLTR